MYRLLIVDDEPVIVESMYALLMEIKRYDVDVYKAYSAPEALTILNTKRMDVILTDIKMPGMSGLQLLEAVHHNWPGCRVIFLTGYSEFEYAYKALQYDGVSYLLKTERYERIVEVVEKTLAEIEKNLKDEDLIKKSGEQIEKALPLLQKEFLNELMDGEKWEYGQKQLDELRIPLIAELPVIVLVGCFDNIPDNIRPQEKLRYFFTIKVTVEKFLSRHAKCIGIIYKGSHMVWLIQPIRKEISDMGGIAADDRELLTLNIKGELESVQNTARELLNTSVSFVLGSDEVRWDGIAEKIYYLKSVLKYRNESGMEMLLTDKDIFSSESIQLFKTNKATQNMQMQLKKLETFTAFLEQGQKDEFFNAFTGFKNNLKEIIEGNERLAYEVYYSYRCSFYLILTDGILKISCQAGSV